MTRICWVKHEELYDLKASEIKLLLPADQIHNEHRNTIKLQQTPFTVYRPNLYTDTNFSPAFLIWFSVKMLLRLWLWISQNEPLPSEQPDWLILNQPAAAHTLQLLPSLHHEKLSVLTEIIIYQQIFFYVLNFNEKTWKLKRSQRSHDTKCNR